MADYFAHSVLNFPDICYPDVEENQNYSWAFHFQQSDWFFSVSQASQNLSLLSSFYLKSTLTVILWVRQRNHRNSPSSLPSACSSVSLAVSLWCAYYSPHCETSILYVSSGLSLFPGRWKVTALISAPAFIQSVPLQACPSNTSGKWQWQLCVSLQESSRRQ